MTPEDGERLLRWYPRPWRARYGDELLAMVEDAVGSEPASRPLRWSLVVSGLREHARRSWLIGPDADREQRIRGGATLVLWGWALLLPAGFSFAKLIEHWQAAVPPSDRTVPSLAVGSAQALALVGATAILFVTAVAAPVLVRSLQGGVWRRLRTSAAVAAWLALAWFGLSVAVVVLAHQLSPAQRNGGSHVYDAMAYGWGTLTIVTIATWTALAIKTERQLQLSHRILRLEAAAAVVVTTAITVVTAAMLTWWASIASTAPWFLHGFVTPGGQAPAGIADSSTWNLQLVLTAVAMVLATAVATAGTVRIARKDRPAVS